MSESIFSLYSDEKFERIRYYLKEQGIIKISDLATFDFNELLFVPGISESLILEAKQLFSFYRSLPVNDTSVNPVYDEVITSSANLDIDKEENKIASSRVDALIADVYSKVPRSKSFIEKCTANGKLFMSQLEDTDFDEAVRLKGIGTNSAENLRRIYIEFINSSIFPQEPLYASKPLDHLPLSVRAKNCLKQAGIFSLEELLALAEKDLMRIKNLGVKTCQEILNFCESVNFSETDASKLYYLDGIVSENKSIPITLLGNIGVPKQGIDLFLSNNWFTVGDLCARGLTPREYSFARTINDYMSVPVTERFIYTIDTLKNNEKVSLLRRCNGATLEEIGKELNLSRERVRQILVKTYQKLTGVAELVASLLFSSDKAFFSFSDLAKLFPSEESAMCCKLVLQESDYVHYLKFCDGFINATVCGRDVEYKLKEFIEEIIGEGTNFYDNLDLIESELKKRKLDYFDAIDIMNFLVHNGYRFYGDYVTKGKQPYVMVCHDAICKFFRFDIKLDSDDNNEDMRLLRQIISRYYRGLTLPPSNRALTAGITRDASKMILSGRGRYCPIEKVIYSLPLFEEVYNFVQNSPQTSFYYSELFSHFKGRFLAETNIDNHYFFHGMLKYLYPNEFTFERDLMTKSGKPRQNIDDRINKLLLEHGRPITRAEIKQAIPGINDFVISFSVMRLPEVIQWDYNEFNHISNIHFTTEDKLLLSNTIKTLTEAHGGYTSDVLLYNALKDKCTEVFTKNNITNAQNLYYIASYFFEGNYRFKRPHILSKDFPIQEITVANIARVLLQCETRLNYEEYCRLALELGWAEGTLYAVFSELEKDFIRISENDYIRKTHFNVSQSCLDTLSHLLSNLLSNSGYYAISSIFDYEKFPKCAYKWNGFLLESIINEYNIKFRIIAPQINDRRHQRGIIVSSDSPYSSFEDLVLASLKSDGIFKISETELLKYLKMRGLIIMNRLPQELYECPEILYKNGTFYI
jgi:DNA-binding CsgD family transcriptional regulator